MPADKHLLWLKLNSAMLLITLLFLAVTEYLHYDAETARRERDTAGRAFAQRILLEQELSERERNLQRDRWEDLMRELAEMDKRLPR